MTAARIKEVALKHFASNGYEGASLADIATDVGIKKQSIYTHFKGKDELFLALLDDVLARELTFVLEYLESHKDLAVDQLLYGFLIQYQDCYEKDDNTKFFLRVAFFPPTHLYEVIVQKGYHYLDTLETMLVPLFEQAIADGAICKEVSSSVATVAFLAVLDGMFVELLFGGVERSMKRIEASWFVYWRGIKK
ncbi:MULTISPECIES: TetR/AcrR family transcriptional regulator [Paenibacillus]|uniref:TetR/AcrR family transcriptional regulator n=1 Tax=Paenibacillus violae TaxID=3077234 RepID=A0ABU3R8M2_9BACL|nr:MULTISPECIES: TetR/AcrR family transcriptional regulator [Paenibacillus]MDU0200625.1 TetR/AcrR family transcriptional regulator [Paenibacillus sp. PFR10]MEC0265509.1 TetR/AcrR family transcriptional regulator [Paenibacillus anseongense]